MTAPLTTPEHDIRDMDGFLLNVERLTASELVVLATGDEFKAAILLWCRAWKQVPAGSLPDDDRILAAFSGAGPRWKKVKEMALRGFIKCDDNRLYHPVLCEDVKRAWAKKQERRERTKAATEARRKPRNEKRDDDRHENRDVARDVNRDVQQNTNVTTSQGREGKRREESNNQTDTTTQPYQSPGDAPPPMAASSIKFPGKHALFDTVRGKVEVLLNSPTCTNLGRIDAWLKAGADPERDIYPTLERLKPKWSGSSLNYFDRAVSDAIAASLGPLPETRRTSQDGQFESQLVASTPEAERALLEAKAQVLKSGNRFDDTSQADVDAMLAAKLVTAEQAQAMGFRA